MITKTMAMAALVVAGSWWAACAVPRQNFIGVQAG